MDSTLVALGLVIGVGLLFLGGRIRRRALRRSRERLEARRRDTSA